MRLQGRASCARCLQLVRKCNLQGMLGQDPDAVFCGSCRRALRALARHGRGHDEADATETRSRSERGWLEGNARDAVAYRKTLRIFNLTTIEDVKRLPFADARLFHRVWTQCMVELMPPDERLALREAMERRCGETLPHLFDCSPEEAYTRGKRERIFF